MGIMTFLKNNFLYYLLISLLTTCMIVFMACAIFVKPVGCDSSYYLSCAELIREGLVPYSDFSLGYTPLYMYIVAGIKNLFGIGINYSFDLFFWCVFFILNIFLVYCIANEIIRERRLAIVASLLYAFLSMRCDGLSVLLEVPSVMFGLLSVLCVLKSNQNILIVLLAGICAFCSFFTKQYGAGFFLLMIFAFCINKQYINAGVYVLGALIACLIAICLVGVDCLDVFVTTSYSGYNEASAPNTFFTPIIKYFDALITLLRIAPIILAPLILGVILLFSKRVIWSVQTKWFVVMFGGIIGFLLQFLFAPFYHYYQYLLPFVAILSIWVVQKLNAKVHIVLWSVLLIMTFVFSMIRIGYNGLFIHLKNDTKNQQEKLAATIQNKIGDKSNSLFIKEGSLMPQYYLSGYKSADRNYSFGNLSEVYYLKTMDMSDYLLIENPSYMLNTPLIINKIENDFSYINICIEGVSLFKNKKSK